jgi:hypothetical protein
MPRRDAFVNRRARLPNRQLAETFDLEIGGLRVDRPIATAPSLPRSRCSTAFPPRSSAMRLCAAAMIRLAARSARRSTSLRGSSHDPPQPTRGAAAALAGRPSAVGRSR